MYIFNPDNGAPIQKVWFEKKVYFEQPFEVGSVINIDYDPGLFMLEIFGFLEEVDEDKAKAIYAKERDFPCLQPGCGKIFKSEKALHGHILGAHSRRTDSGIPIAEGEEVKKKAIVDDSFQGSIEQEAKKDGLIGGGVEHETIDSL